MTFLSAETRTKGEAVGEGFLIYKNSFSYRPVGFVLRTFKKSNTQVFNLQGHSDSCRARAPRCPAQGVFSVRACFRALK